MIVCVSMWSDAQKEKKRLFVDVESRSAYQQVEEKVASDVFIWFEWKSLISEALIVARVNFECSFIS